ncbi:precorrin-2 dehydrogenase/sirohydrochlorin ferrochelatase family protein [Natronospora cellulosivora (SeqCode)]
MQERGDIIYYPLFINIEEKPCLIVGAGKIALKKAKKLMEYGAEVEILSSDIDEDFYQIIPDEKLIKKDYQKKYIKNKFMVIAATDDYQLNKKIAADAKEEGALFNAVDQIELCQFIVPAIVNRKDLQIAISTSGKSPALAGIIRRELESTFGSEYEDYLKELGVLREYIKDKVKDPKLRKDLLIKMAELVYERGSKNAESSQEIKD